MPADLNRHEKESDPDADDDQVDEPFDVEDYIRIKLTASKMKLIEQNITDYDIFYKFNANHNINYFTIKPDEKIRDGVNVFEKWTPTKNKELNTSRKKEMDIKYFAKINLKSVP